MPGSTAPKLGCRLATRLSRSFQVGDGPAGRADAHGELVLAANQVVLDGELGLQVEDLVELAAQVIARCRPSGEG